MINRSAKGKRNEKKTENYLEDLGFIVESVKQVKSFSSRDLFGLWDHIAIAQEYVSLEVENINNKKLKMTMAFIPGDTLYIQTKTNNKPSSNAMVDHIYSKNNSHKLLVVWKDRIKEPRLISLNEAI